MAEEIEVTLTTELLDGTCDHSECEDDETDSGFVYWGISGALNQDDAYTYIAEYCEDHSQSHAEINERLFLLGSFDQ